MPVSINIISQMSTIIMLTIDCVILCTGIRLYIIMWAFMWKKINGFDYRLKKYVQKWRSCVQIDKEF